MTRHVDTALKMAEASLKRLAVQPGDIAALRYIQEVLNERRSKAAARKAQSDDRRN